MLNIRDSLDIKLVLDKILKKLEKLDVIEFILRDMFFRFIKVEMVVEKLEREKWKMNLEINMMDIGFVILNNEVFILWGEIMVKEEWINYLYMKYFYFEFSYSWCENLKFFGILEKEVNIEEGGEVFDIRVVLN